MCNECYQMGVVPLLQHLRDPCDLGVTMGGRVVAPLSTVRPCGRATKRALDMCGSPNIVSSYLLSWYEGNE
jgi:hypothetical protein